MIAIRTLMAGLSIAALSALTWQVSLAGDIATESTTIGELDEYVISESQLDTQRAKGVDFLQFNENDLDANLNNNIVNGGNTGNNSVTNDAFTGASGFATVIQNSGNHVIIQNSTIVNLTIEK